MAEVKFQVLGPLAVTIDGVQVSLRGSKHRTVLAALLVSKNQRASIPRLVDAVWDVAPPSTADKQVRNAVSNLRNVLEPTGASIVSVPDGYRLDIGTAELDLHRFQQQRDAAQAHLRARRPAEAVTAFRTALATWSGQMLADVHSQMLRALAARTQEARLSVAEDCLDLELAAGAHRDVVAELAEWAERNPLRERLVAQYMLALHRCGSRARAFEVYERTRRNLADSLGLVPGLEITTVHREMLSEEANSSSSPADSGYGLPPSPAELVGRAAETAALLNCATVPGRQRVLAVDGMAGVGKTVLTLHVAHQLKAEYPDGQFFVDLRGHDPALSPLDLRTALRRLLVLGGAQDSALPEDIEELTLAWRRRTASARLLVVLDNLAQADHLGPLLPSGEGCLTLVTGRRRLALTAPMPIQVLALDLLPRHHSRELLHRLLGNLAERADPAAIESILDHCGDLPLALSASAARLRRRPTWTVRYLAERLADPSMRLSELQTEHGGVLAAYDSWVRDLGQEHRAVLRLLGTAPGDPLDQDPAEALDTDWVAARANWTTEVTERVLQDLVDEHLLLHPEPGRYGLHPLVRLYCARVLCGASVKSLAVA